MLIIVKIKEENKEKKKQGQNMITKIANLYLIIIQKTKIFILQKPMVKGILIIYMI